MKTLLMLLMPALLLMGEQPTKEKKPAPKPAPAASENTQKIPDGAKEIEPYTYSYTDPQGKKWIYRQMPFGVVRREDKPVAAPVIDNSPPVIVNDLGDSVEFQWKTPFGSQKTVRKKSELTEDEKAIVRREQSKPSAADAKAADKPEKR